MIKSAMYLNGACFKEAQEGDGLCEGTVVLEEGAVILVTTTGSRFIEMEQIRQPMVGAYVKVWLREGKIVVERTDVMVEEKKRKVVFQSTKHELPVGYFQVTPDYVRGRLMPDMKDILSLNSILDHEKNPLVIEGAWVSSQGWCAILSGRFPKQFEGRMFTAIYLSHKDGAVLNQKMIEAAIIMNAPEIMDQNDFYTTSFTS